MVFAYIVGGFLVVTTLYKDMSITDSNNQTYLVLFLLTLLLAIIARWYSVTGKLNFYISLLYLLIPPATYVFLVWILESLR